MAGQMRQNTVDFWPDGIEIYIALYLFYTSLYFSVNQWGQSKNRRNLIFFPKNSNLNNFFRLLMRCWHHNKTKSMFAGQKWLTKGYYIVQCVAGILTSLTWLDGLIQGSSQFSLLPKKYCSLQSGLKIIISLLISNVKSKYLIHSVVQQKYGVVI